MFWYNLINENSDASINFISILAMFMYVNLSSVLGGTITLIDILLWFIIETQSNVQHTEYKHLSRVGCALGDKFKRRMTINGRSGLAQQRLRQIKGN